MSEQTIGLAHELWAMAQLAPGEGIEDGAARIAERLERDKFRPLMSDQPRPTPSKPLRFFQCLYDEKRDACYFETPTGRSRWYAKQGACKTDAFLAKQECKRRGWILNRESDAREERIRGLEGHQKEISAIAKLLSWEHPYQASLVKRVETLIGQRDGLKMQVSELEAENAKLREALRPFSDEYSSWMDDFEDAAKVRVLTVNIGLTVGDLRCARQALAGEEERSAKP